MPAPVHLVAVAIVLSASSGLPVLFDRVRGFRAAPVLGVASAVFGLAAAGWALASGESRLALEWSLPFGRLGLGVDALAAAFLLPLFFVAALVWVYSHAYFDGPEQREQRVTVFPLLGVCVASIAGVFVATDGICFLIAWEVMALSAMFLVVTDHRAEGTREAGFIYLMATHTGTLCLFAAFIVLGVLTGGSELSGVPTGAASAPLGTAVFVLSLLGFGIKAGLMPAHVWLPAAHAAAPTPVSALMSGVLIKTGIYGLVRLTSLFPDPPLWWGASVLTLGLLSAVGGVAYALGQHDIKRLLAYHSVENIGIIAMGLGVALVGRSMAQPAWVALGLAAALFHVQNHAIFKSLLFFGAGSVIHATHSRELEKMGGLLRAMPWTGATFLVGAVAISGLPPLNGFVSEWLLYLALFDTLGAPGESAAWLWGALSAPGLALVGALALACFVKAFGGVFLGTPRTEAAARAHESPPAMLVPMLIGAATCVFLGIAPQAVVPLLDRAVTVASRGVAPNLGDRAAFGGLTVFGLGLVALSLLLVALVRRRARSVRREVTWDCGYAKPAASMQYTSSSFAEWLMRLLGWGLRPARHSPDLALDPQRAPRLEQLFPREARFSSHVADLVLERGIAPALAWLVRAASRARWLQQGRVQSYLLYIFVALVVLLSRV
ncbi:MAG: hypothetical protein IPM35_37295 [Myxococcales bacterium]|nr:hypothetical protein [Myxococcales bacterium]